MARILMIKKYWVNTSKGRFRIFVSRHSDLICYSGVLWYRKSGTWAKGEEVLLEYDLENFINTSEEVVFEEAVEWVRKNLDPNAEIIST